jgi:hypothetical protein
MRRTRSAVAGTAVLAAVSLGAPSAAYPPPVPLAHPPHTRVEPSTLARGPAPRVLFYDQRLHLVRDGAREVPARFPGQVTALARVVGGYLLDSEQPTGASTIRLVDGRGRSRVLARVANLGVLGVVSTDRRLVAYDAGVHRNRMVVMRVRDGRVVASRRFRSGGARVVAAGPHRALVQNGSHTYWWSYRGAPLSRVASDPVARAALGVGLVVLAWHGTDRFYLTSLSPGSGPAWSWQPGQPPGPFSPDGRRLLTLTPAPGARYAGGLVRIRVRGTRHGHVARIFTGRFGVEGFDPQVRWETSTSFLVLAREPATADPVTRMAWVRCTVGGSCETAGPVFSVDLDRPPYGPSPWVLADQPSH